MNFRQYFKFSVNLRNHGKFWRCWKNLHLHYAHFVLIYVHFALIYAHFALIYVYFTLCAHFNVFKLKFYGNSILLGKNEVKGLRYSTWNFLKFFIHQKFWNLKFQLTNVIVENSDAAGKILQRGRLARRTVMLPLDKMNASVISTKVISN